MESPVKSNSLWKSNPRINNNNNIVVVTRSIPRPTSKYSNSWNIFYKYKEINSRYSFGLEEYIETLVSDKEYSRDLESFMYLFVPDQMSEYIL